MAKKNIRSNRTANSPGNLSAVVATLQKLGPELELIGDTLDKVSNRINEVVLKDTDFRKESSGIKHAVSVHIVSNRLTDQLFLTLDSLSASLRHVANSRSKLTIESSGSDALADALVKIVEATNNATIDKTKSEALRTMLSLLTAPFMNKDFRPLTPADTEKISVSVQELNKIIKIVQDARFDISPDIIQEMHNAVNSISEITELLIGLPLDKLSKSGIGILKRWKIQIAFNRTIKFINALVRRLESFEPGDLAGARAKVEDIRESVIIINDVLDEVENLKLDSHFKFLDFLFGWIKRGIVMMRIKSSLRLVRSIVNYINKMETPDIATTRLKIQWIHEAIQQINTMLAEVKTLTSMGGLFGLKSPFPNFIERMILKSRVRGFIRMMNSVIGYINNLELKGTATAAARAKLLDIMVDALLNVAISSRTLGRGGLFKSSPFPTFIQRFRIEMGVRNMMDMMKQVQDSINQTELGSTAVTTANILLMEVIIRAITRLAALMGELGRGGWFKSSPFPSKKELDNMVESIDVMIASINKVVESINEINTRNIKQTTIKLILVNQMMTLLFMAATLMKMAKKKLGRGILGRFTSFTEGIDRFIKNVTHTIQQINDLQTNDINQTITRLALLTYMFSMMDLMLSAFILSAGLIVATMPATLIIRAGIKWLVSTIVYIINSLDHIDKIRITKVLTVQNKIAAVFNVLLFVALSMMALGAILTVGIFVTFIGKVLPLFILAVVAVVAAVRIVGIVLNTIKNAMLLNTSAKMAVIVGLIAIIGLSILALMTIVAWSSVITFLTTTMLAIVVAVIGMIFAVWLMMRIVNMISLPMLGMMFIKLVAITGMLLVVALIFNAFNLIGDDVLQGIISGTKIVIAIVLFTLVLAVFALLAAGLSLIATAALVGMGTIVLMVGALFLIAGMLWLLQFINLDINLIHAKVAMVMDTVTYIIDTVWESVAVEKGESDPSFINMAKTFLKGVLSALLACTMLVLTVVSVASILMIAGMLRLLQTIDLDHDKIKKNVGEVLSTTRQIIDTLFQKDEKEGESKRGILGMLFDLFYPPLGAVLDALLSMAYLFLMTVSIACVFGIAAMLKQLGEMDMDKIQRGRENAGKVLDATREMIDRIMYPDDKGDTASPRRGMMALVGKFFPGIANILEAIFSVGYLALMFIGIACIKGIANSLIELANIDEKTINTAKDNAVKVVSAARQIMSQIFQKENEENTKTNKSWLQKLLEWTGIADIKEVVDAIMNIGKLAVLIVGIGSIAKLADQMKQIAETTIDTKTVTSKGTSIVNAATTIFNSIRTKTGDVDEDDVEDTFDKLKPMTKVFEQLAKVATSMDNMSKVQLKQGVLTGFTNLFVSETQQSFSRLNTSLPTDLTNQTQQSIQRTGAVLDRLRQLTNKYASMGSDRATESLQRSTQNQLRTWEDMKLIFSTIEQTDVDDKGVRQRLELLDRISLSIKRFAKVNDADVKNSRAVVDNYIRFIDRVDKSQIAKLKTTEQLMKHWADLSRSINGDFEGLSKTINEHILPAINKLDETMRGVTKTQQEIIDLMKQDEMQDMMNTGMGGTGASGGAPMMTIPSGGNGDAGMSGDTTGVGMESIAGATPPQTPVNNAGVANPPQKTVKSNRTNRSNSSRASEYEISTALADIAKAIRGN